MAYYKKRYYPKRKKNTGKYRSGLEKRLGEVLIHCEYEKRKIEYIIPKVYNPDFTFPDKDWLLVEAKGRFFNGTDEAKKYIEFSKQHKDKEIVFIFERLYQKPYTSVKRRKDGSIMTCGEWAAKHNFVFFGEKEMPNWFIEGNFDRDTIIDLKRTLRQEWLGKI